MTHSNAQNTRTGLNLKSWYCSRASVPGSTPEFMLSTTKSLHGSAPTVAMKTMRKGGSSSHLRRGWADKMIHAAASSLSGSLASTPAEAASRAFDIANRMMGLGQSAHRVGVSKDQSAAVRQATGVDKFVACVEFDSCDDTKTIFAEMARMALRGSANASHLAMHLGYGAANGYRGTHMMVSIDELLGADLRVDSSMDARGASIHVYATIDGARYNLLSFKRKGGDGPSEPYPDQLQATLLVRGTRAASQKLASTVSRRVTSRSILNTVPTAALTSSALATITTVA